jgi:hypothetical protein
MRIPVVGIHFVVLGVVIMRGGWRTWCYIDSGGKSVLEQLQILNKLTTDWRREGHPHPPHVQRGVNALSDAGWRQSYSIKFLVVCQG